MANVPLNDSLSQQFPSNSYSVKNSLQGNVNQSQRLQKVVKNPAVKKENLGRKLVNVFIGADISDVGHFLVWDCILPSVKDAILDSIMMMFGETPNRRPRTTNYNSIYNNNQKPQNVNYGSYSTQQSRPQVGRSPASRFEGDDICFMSKEDAMDVLDALVDQVVDLGYASVAAFYDLSGTSIPNATDYDWGWTDLSSAEIRRTRDGWKIRFPKITNLR